VFALRGRAKEGERALGGGLYSSFGTLLTKALRSDNGLVLQRRGLPSGVPRLS
jgi:hypothetical protein